MPFVAGVRWSLRGKDAGRVDSGVLSMQPRTQHRGVQRGPAAQLCPPDPYVRGAATAGTTGVGAGRRASAGRAPTSRNPANINAIPANSPA